MNLFVEQLKALKTTMSRVVPLQFDMTQWVSEDNNSCGTVACVCGHQAISGDLTHFASSKSRAEIGDEAYSVASSVSDDLDGTCFDLFCNTYLSESLWQIDPDSRIYEAEESKMLTPEQLKHPHLTTNSSPQCAVSYIDMLIEILS